MLFVILFFLLSLILVMYKLNYNDIMSPPVLLILGYIVTDICSIYNAGRWNSDISILMGVIVMFGVLAFCVGGYLGTRARIDNKRHAYVFAQSQQNTINEQLDSFTQNPRGAKIIVIIIFCLLMTMLLYDDIVRVAYSNFREWDNLAYNYKKNKTDVELNGMAKLANMMTRGLAYAYLFAFVNNITAEGKIKFKSFFKNFLLLGPGIIFSAQSLLLGGRIGIIGYLLAGVFMYLTLRYLRCGKKLRISFKTTIIVLIAAAVILTGFYQVRDSIGRISDASNVDYITSYLGGSMDLFSQYLRNPMGQDKKIETFAGIINNLQSYFGIFKGVGITTSHEFRDAATGETIGNTYTGFRSYYNDLGFFGVVFFSFMLAFIFSAVYSYIRRMKHITKRNICVFVIYAYELYCIPFHFFTDYFFTGVSINKALNYLCIIIAVYFVFNRKRSIDKQ